jgi:hypothetical protein
LAELENVSIEQAAWAEWVANPWHVRGGAEIEKIEACPGVDLTVALEVDLWVAHGFRIIDNALRREIQLILRVRSDASDWDTFRCWVLTSLGPSVVIGIAGGIVAGVVAGLVSLISISEIVRVSAGKEVAGQQLGPQFEKVAGDETSATYRASMALPIVPLPTTDWLLDQIESNESGFIIPGTGSIGLFGREAIFEPNAPNLVGVWSGWFSCRQHRWVSSYDLNSILIRDNITLLGAPAGQNGVRVFPTSSFKSASGTPLADPQEIAPGSPEPMGGLWFLDVPPNEPASPLITPRRTAPPPEGEHVFLFLHTSAGIKRYEIGPVPETVAAPTGPILVMYEGNCKQLTLQFSPIQRMKWLIDPPPYEYGHDPLRQWMVTLNKLPADARVTVRQRGDGALPAFVQTFDGASSGFIEVVTHAEVELEIEHNLGRTPTEARVQQRWLIPTRMERISGEVDSIAIERTRSRRDGSEVRVTTRHTKTLTDRGLVETQADPQRANGSPPHSVSLSSGLVAAVYGDQLVLAVPFGGPRESSPAPSSEVEAG